MGAREEIKKLIQLNEELENYFRNTIIPQLFVDANLVLRKYTPPAMKQFNLKPSDIGKPLIEMINNIRFPSIISNIKNVIDTNQILEKEIQTTDLRWYQMNILPYVVQKNNKPNGVIITFVDITLRIKDLRDQEKLIADHEILIDTISHDIKNPLSSLIVAVDLFKTISLTNIDELKSVLSTIERAILKMQKVITELTDTRRQEHKYKTEKELLNIEHILEDIRLTLSEDIIQSDVTISCEINISEFTFSRRKLRSIIYNLVSNAIKYKSLERKPEIFIRTSRENGFIVISVKDNGIGIHESKLKDVFTKYYRVDNTIEGSGVGLFLINEIVKNTGGRIVLDSSVGRGSEFKVYLKSE
jgi:two-component system phosphate regulon sensor histidine kinase PhoR